MDDFENFEFIDYTTSGPWERFITQIEESLRSWGLVDKKLGVFDPATIAEQHAEDNIAGGNSSSPRTHAHGAGTHDTSTNGQKPQSQQTYQVREMLSLDDATYALSYHYHPAKTKIAEGADRIDLDFLPTTLDGVQYHNLHRWTSLTHLLIISPVTISDIFASTMSMSSSSSVIIDLSSAKMLLSSFAIAFQNTGCSVPVFVPTGQPWDLTFTGLMLQSPTPPTPDLGSRAAEDGTFLYVDEYEDESDQGIEVRFNTFLVPYPPIHYSSLSGITSLFIEKMGIVGHIDTLGPEASIQMIKDQIFTTALFCYDLVNWYDEDWKRWKQSSGKEKITDPVDGDGPALNSPEASMNMDEIHPGGRTFSTLPTPVFPFGPVQDPLRSIRLFARFATAPSSLYLDNRTITDMDASFANIWILQAAFKGDDYGVLGAILEEAIASWSKEAISNGHDDRDSERDQSYGDSILNKGAKLIQGAISMVDSVDVENILEALFEPQTTPISPTPASPAKPNPPVRLVPASELGLQFRRGTTVPYNSFLWKMVQYLLDVISPNSDISYPTSVMGFMKVLWSELLKQLYTRFENMQLIPSVDIYGDGYPGAPGTAMTGNVNQDEERKPVAIDLRFNLLHQKLAMLNCCIARQIARDKEAPGDILSLPRRRRDPLFEDSGSPPLSSPPNPPSGMRMGAVHRRSAQLQSLLHGLSDMSRPRSADVVPMAKRLFETVKNRAVPPQAPPAPQVSPASSTSPSTSSSGILIPTATSKVEDGSDASLPHEETLSRRPRDRSLRHEQSAETLLDSDDDDVFYDSVGITRPIDIQRNTLPLTESFVALKYSSSADSQSGVLVSEVEQTTVIAHGPDPREVADETKSEGCLKPLKDLKLLKTGTPLMIPKVQEPGYMTDDMIQQQEELLETYGSTSHGARMRAKAQSSQLISDMEAFKAANPGCVLGDFIRWHSPKDWVEDTGEISKRMADAGNYWQELWAEAAKVLFYLDNISPDQVFLQLLPTMSLIAYDTLVSHPIGRCIPLVAQALRDLGKELTRFPWDELELANGEDMNLNAIMDRFREVELLMGRAIALVRKFPDQFDLVERILKDRETVVEDGPERECVYDLFSIGGSQQSTFPQPTSREFVLETYDPAPETSISVDQGTWDSRPVQRRMYACFKESEVRIVETIAKDSLYM
ncbi:Rab3 GTPase-activating protein catalytic subunit-domain-containing protein [Mortierella sp. GBAus27b]|nr:Rab3 GTPase-activating protein catalytic subunit-domain-containing protein [Mortierella sp. GBAus27b]